MVFVKHGGFGDIISSNVLSGPFCLIVSSVTSIFYVLVCLMVFHRFWRLFKNLFFRLDNFCWSIFKFISSSRSPILLTSVVIFFLFVLFIYILQLGLIISISIDIFYLCHYKVFFNSLEHIYNHCFRVFQVQHSGLLRDHFYWLLFYFIFFLSMYHTFLFLYGCHIFANLETTLL